MYLRTCLCLLISISLSFGLLSGCAEINKIIDDVNQNVKPEEDRPSASSPAAPENPPRASSTTPESPPRATSPVRVSLDGHGDEASDNYGIYWETANSVSATPKMVFRLDPSMGDFHSCILNIYEAKPDGTEKKNEPLGVRRAGRRTSLEGHVSQFAVFSYKTRRERDNYFTPGKTGGCHAVGNREDLHHAGGHFRLQQ